MFKTLLSCHITKPWSEELERDFSFECLGFITILKTTIRTNALKVKSFIDNNEQIADFRHGYDSSLPPKIFLDFDKSLFGKIFKVLGSMSATITIILRATIPASGTLLSYINDIQSAKLVLALIGFIYSVYLVINSFYRIKNSLYYIIKGNWIKRNSPLDAKGSIRRIAGTIISNVTVLGKFVGAVGVTGLSFDQGQELFGMSENHKWRLKRNTIILGKKLGISDHIIEYNNTAFQQKVEIDKEVLEKLQEDSKILHALKKSKDQSKGDTTFKSVSELVSFPLKDP